MISWIQRTLQHHFKIVFVLLLVATVIPFIFVIGSTPGVGRGDRSAVTRLFFGRNVASAEDMHAVYQGAFISLDLQGTDDATPEQEQTYAFTRLAALHLADEMHLPAPDEAAIDAHIRSLPKFADKNGDFDPSLYEDYRAKIKTDGRFSEADIAQTIKDDVRLESVEKLLAGPGYVLPSDVRRLMLEADTSWTIAVASVDYASYRPKYEPTADQLDRYFSSNSFRYEIPPEISADAVIFQAADFAGQVTATDDDVRALYDQDPSQFPAPVAKASVEADASAAFAAVRPKVEAALRLQRARDLAAKAASDFAVDLYQSKIQPGDSLASYLASHHLSPKPLAPFTHDAGPAELGSSPEIADAAFKLSADRFYSDALACPQGAVVLLWKDLLPSRQPALAEVSAKVRLDAIEAEKRERFVSLGQSLSSSIQKAVRAGTSFEKAAQLAAAAAGVRIAVTTPAPFTLTDAPKDLSRSVLGALEHLDKGQVSDMAATETNGTLVYAIDRKLPSQDERSPAYLTARERLARYYAQGSSRSAFPEIVDAELQRTAPNAH